MINLLPPPSLASRRRAYRARRVVVAVWLFMSVVLGSLIVDLVFYWTVHGRSRSVALQLAELNQQADVRRFNELAAWLDDLNHRLLRLDYEPAPPSFTQLWPQLAAQPGAVASKSIRERGIFSTADYITFC